MPPPMPTDLSVRSAAAVDLAEDAALARITEAAIHRLVHDFYGRIRADAALGPIFAGAVAPERWPLHLDKMCAFWSSVLLRTHRYDGRPMPPHLRLDGLGDAQFQRWLDLFLLSARAAFDPAAAAVVIARAERIAYSFRLAIAFHHGRASTGLTPQHATPPAVWGPEIRGPADES